MQNESISEGPAPGREASPAAAVPIVAKIPAPIIAPMPSKVTLKAPSDRFRACFSSLREARMSSRFLVRKIPRSNVSPPDWNLKIVESRLTRGRKEMLAEFGMEGGKREREKGGSLVFGL